MKTNAAGLALIKQFESLRLEAYLDPVGILTIGYGHTGPDVTPGLQIDEAQADRLLALDLGAAERAVTGATNGKRAPNENQFSAMVSFTFNVGAGALLSSSVLKLFLAGDDAGAAKAFALWNKGTNADGKKVELKGLTRRRAAEAVLYLTPTGAIEERPQLTAAQDAQPAGLPFDATKAVSIATTAGTIIAPFTGLFDRIPNWAFGGVALIAVGTLAATWLIDRARAK